MAKFRKKPVDVEAITWGEFIEHGRKYVEDHPEIGNYGPEGKTGLPWSFRYNGYAITHENDECYLVNTSEGYFHMTPEDVLVIEKGVILTYEADTFEESFEPL